MRPAGACNRHGGARAKRQGGVTLLFTLMALLVVATGALALSLSVQLGSLMIGNLGFKNDAVAAGAAGAEEAAAWLDKYSAGAFLESNHVDEAGYYATALEDLDATGTLTTKAKPMQLVQWDGNGKCSDDFSPCTVKPYRSTKKVNGNDVQWVITRLCAAAGPPGTTNSCARPPAADIANSADRGEVVVGGRITIGNITPYFRIIVRVAGPRNTVSYTETMVHF